MSKKLFVGCCLVAAACGTFAMLRPSAGQNPFERHPDSAPVRAVTGGQGVQGFGYAVFSPDSANAPQETRLNLKVDEALQKYTAAKDEDGKRAAREQLSSSLGELFDLRQKQREEEIKQIEDRVAKLRETLKKRESKRQELIEHHLTTIVQDAEGLGWGGDTAGGNVLYRPGMPAPAGVRTFDVRALGPVPVLPSLPAVPPRVDPPKKNEPQM